MFQSQKLILKSKLALLRKIGQTAVLCYHRIGDVPIDHGANLWTSEENFSRQISVMKQMATVISLPEWFDRFENNNLGTKRYIIITFDDGYFDNFEKGLPILEKWNCPATFFINSNPTLDLGTKSTQRVHSLV